MRAFVEGRTSCHGGGALASLAEVDPTRAAI